jgi:hypothetical protein
MIKNILEECKMMANIMETLLRLMEEEIQVQSRKPLHERDMTTLSNLAAKSHILRGRGDKSAAVIRELSRY